MKNHLVAAAKHTGALKNILIYFQSLIKHFFQSDVRVAVVVGGMAQVKQERILEKGPEIVVATPGRLWEMIQQGNDHLSQVSDIRCVLLVELKSQFEFLIEYLYNSSGIWRSTKPIE